MTPLLATPVAPTEIVGVEGECDEWLGLVEVNGEPTAGCVQRVQLDIAPEWYSVALAGAVLIIVALYAILIAQLRRG